MSRRGSLGDGDARPLAVLARTAFVLRRLGGLLPTLTPEERARAAELRRESVREDYLAAHLLVRHCAGVLLGEPPDALPLEVAPGARPRIAGAPGLGISLSHTAGWVAAAASPHPIAVDVEASGTRLAAGLPELAIWTPAERALLAAQNADDRTESALVLWTRKEALVKLGVGALDSLRDVDAAAPDAARVSHRSTGECVACVAVPSLGIPPEFDDLSPEPGGLPR